MKITSVLVLVDVQNDFCPGGALAVSEGNKVVEPLNRMIELAIRRDWEIYASRDWHPTDTEHFKTWPVHCVQNTQGAEFHPDLRLPEDYQKFQIVSKGTRNADDYSAFDGGMMPVARHLYVGGLATDYCVLWTVRKALSLGYTVTLLLDACRAVNLKDGDGERAIEEMRLAGAKISSVEDVENELDT